MLKRNCDTAITIKNVTLVVPQIKVSRIFSDITTTDDIMHQLKDQNIWLANANISIDRIYEIDTASGIYRNLIINCDLASQLLFIQKGSVIFGFSEFRCFEHVNILQCNKCMRFGHFARECTFTRHTKLSQMWRRTWKHGMSIWFKSIKMCQLYCEGRRAKYEAQSHRRSLYHQTKSHCRVKRNFYIKKTEWQFQYANIITWIYGDEDSGLRSPSLYNFGKQEKKMIEVCAAYNLIQKNNIANYEGRFLDLVFTTYLTNFSTSQPQWIELIDQHQAGAV